MGRLDGTALRSFHCVSASNCLSNRVLFKGSYRRNNVLDFIHFNYSLFHGFNLERGEKRVRAEQEMMFSGRTE